MIEIPRRRAVDCFLNFIDFQILFGNDFITVFVAEHRSAHIARPRRLSAECVLGGIFGGTGIGNTVLFTRKIMFDGYADLFERLRACLVGIIHARLARTGVIFHVARLGAGCLIAVMLRHIMPERIFYDGRGNFVFARLI